MIPSVSDNILPVIGVERILKHVSLAAAYVAVDLIWSVLIKSLRRIPRNLHYECRRLIKNLFALHCVLYAFSTLYYTCAIKCSIFPIFIFWLFCLFSPLVLYATPEPQVAVQSRCSEPGVGNRWHHIYYDEWQTRASISLPLSFSLSGYYSRYESRNNEPSFTGKSYTYRLWERARYDIDIRTNIYFPQHPAYR